MNKKLTPIASAVALLIVGVSISAQAQQVPTPDQPVVDQVTVTGIRAALQKSLEQKRSADTDVEVVTAEDVGKMPDKNVADALQRVPGINTASQAGGEGGFDEQDRVSIRGTSPSLTQVTIDGHMVSSGDWFLLDQFQTVGRSVSLSLLPSELVSSIVVSKSPTADLIEGGSAGDVDIKTPKPLEFKDQVTAEATVGGVYSDLPKKTEPQFNALVNWKNEEKTFGILLEAFDEHRDVERYGQETLGYANIAPTNPIAVANPSLSGIAAPTYIGSALFNQTRVREGGNFAMDLKLSNDLSFDLNGFYSHMDANNSNINFMANVSGNGGTVQQGILPTSYTVQNGTLTGATFPVGAPAAGVVDSIFRTAYSESKYLDLDGKYRVNNNLVITGKAGTTQGIGSTTSSESWEANFPGGQSYQMHGISSPTTVSWPGGQPTNYGTTSTGWLWNEIATSTDKENYGQLDGNLTLDEGVLDSMKFGVRYAQHTHTVAFPLDGGCCLAGGYSNTPAYTGATYPSNFSSVTGGAFGGGWLLTSAAVTNFFNTYGKGGPADPVDREYWPGEENLTEKDTAGYVMANLAGKDWSGNIGLRLVHTAEDVLDNAAEPGTGYPAGTITTSAFGNYLPTPIDHTYNDILPSANFKFDLSKDLVARLGVANTMARPDFEALGGAVSLTDSILTGQGGNPNLKPIRSTNWDGTLEWYFAPRSLLSASLFYMDFQSYVDYGVTNQTWFDQLLNKYNTYAITSPENTSATNKGIELSYQQTYSNGFGAIANFTLADGSTADGTAMVGNSKDTYNVVGYYEGHNFTARLAYTYRSASLVGLDRSFDENEAGVGNLAAAIGYTINKNFSVSFDALNLNNAPLEYYGNNTSQPRAIYYNGRQYYFTLHAKL